MQKFIDNAKVIIRHNVFLAVAVVFVLVGGIWLVGCNSKTSSPFNPNDQVTRDQLIIQVNTYNEQVKLAFKDLDKQDAFKQYLINEALVVMQGGTLNPTGIVLGALGLLGLGATADNVRKNTVIRTLKNAQKTETV